MPVDKLYILAKALKITPACLIGWEKSNYNFTYEEIELTTIEDTMKSILKQPLFISHCGYNTKKMTDEDLDTFSKDILRYIRLLSYEYK